MAKEDGIKKERSRALTAMQQGLRPPVGDALPVHGPAGRAAVSAPADQRPPKEGRAAYGRMTIDFDVDTYDGLRKRALELGVPAAAIVQALSEDYLAGRIVPVTSPQTVKHRRRRK